MYEINVTHPWHSASVSEEYAPKALQTDSPETAALLFLANADHPKGLDAGELTERLHKGRLVKHQDRETGRTVTVHAVIAEAGDRCVRCVAPYQGTAGWQRTTAGLLCPDCAAKICPDDAAPVTTERAAV